MTNEVLFCGIMMLITTNWSEDLKVRGTDKLIHIGRLQTNYVYTPEIRKFPIITSQPFYGPYEFVKEVTIEPKISLIQGYTNFILRLNDPTNFSKMFIFKTNDINASQE